jgi:hypothetical protein
LGRVKKLVGHLASEVEAEGGSMGGRGTSGWPATVVVAQEKRASVHASPMLSEFQGMGRGVGEEWESSGRVVRE